MSLSAAYLAMLCVGLSFMLMQLLVKQKRLEHIFFAIFCGSMAMVAAQQLSAQTLGPYKYLFGLGACVTCNGMWLVSKAMFSGEDSITRKHILFALLIAMLIIINNFIHMAYELSGLGISAHGRLVGALGEFINLFSSTVLALTCWEALNGLSKQTRQEFWLRILFVTSFCCGFLLCTVVTGAFFAADVQPLVFPWLVFISALQIMIVTQVILWCRQYKTTTEPNLTIQAIVKEASDIEDSLISGIKLIIYEDKRYLTHNLKMIDVANELNVSEYKVSRAIRYHFAAPNFNHFINGLRIEYAKNLLELSETQHWSILMISMESGFSSLATFNRVFKSQLGHTPSVHRKKSILNDGVQSIESESVIF